jgi:hypothetical protein
MGKSCRAHTTLRQDYAADIAGFYVGSDGPSLRRTSFAVRLLTYIAGNRTLRGPPLFLHMACERTALRVVFPSGYTYSPRRLYAVVH